MSADEKYFGAFFTPCWAHPKAMQRMAEALEKLASNEDWTDKEKQVRREAYNTSKYINKIL